MSPLVQQEGRPGNPFKVESRPALEPDLGAGCFPLMANMHLKFPPHPPPPLLG